MCLSVFTSHHIVCFDLPRIVYIVHCAVLQSALLHIYIYFSLSHSHTHCIHSHATQHPQLYTGHVSCVLFCSLCTPFYSFNHLYFPAYFLYLFIDCQLFHNFSYFIQFTLFPPVVFYFILFIDFSHQIGNILYLQNILTSFCFCFCLDTLQQGPG